LLALALAGSVAALAAASSPAVANAAPPAPTSTQTAPAAFSDIHGDEPYAIAAAALAEQAVMLRHSDGSLDPDGTVSRAEMAYFLARAMDLGSSSSTGPFSDVTAYDWYASSVVALHENGLAQGTSRTTFSPSRTVTRQEAATLVMRAVAFTRKDDGRTAALLKLTDREARLWLGGFRDRQLIQSFSVVAVAAAYRLRILDCPLDGWYFPAGNLTRAEMAVMLYRAFLRPPAVRSAYPVQLQALPEYTSLSSGSKGALVSYLETRLTALHYPCGPLDGVYDHRTSDAVMAFQKVERLSRTGTVNAQVWEKLATAGIPQPKLTGTGDRCEVDLTRQVLFMVSGDEVTEVVHVSTGKLGTRTGHFSIGAKYEGWVKCVTLDGKMYYPSYVVSKTAIHGFESVPPYPASHGCVRVPVWTAEGLYQQLPTGTVVDIHL
jgi:peptidoglycan hydrolase-like protein with peptidoglycan-binding domain